MVVGELEYKINEQKNEIKLLKKNNCKLQNYNNDLERQQEILFNLIYDILIFNTIFFYFFLYTGFILLCLTF